MEQPTENPTVNSESGPLTQDLETCSNPLCSNPLLDGASSRRRFCSDCCRMDVWALRRAARLLEKVGTVEFFKMLSKLER